MEAVLQSRLPWTAEGGGSRCTWVLSATEGADPAALPVVTFSKHFLSSFHKCSCSSSVPVKLVVERVVIPDAKSCLLSILPLQPHLIPNQTPFWLRWQLSPLCLSPC